LKRSRDERAALVHVDKGVYDFKDDDKIDKINYNLMKSLNVNEAGFSLDNILSFTIKPMFTDLPKANYDQYLPFICTLKAKKSDKKETKNLLNSEFRAPIDLICVLDISGSMSGKKMYLLNETMGFIIHHLQKIDRISIVVFNDKAQRITRLRRLTPDGKI
jgi:hypothetical protein